MGSDVDTLFQGLYGPIIHSVPAFFIQLLKQSYSGTKGLDNNTQILLIQPRLASSSA